MNATFEALPVSAIPSELMRDLNPRARPWAVVRTGISGRQMIWGFHINERSARLAVRRWTTRQIVTR